MESSKSEERDQIDRPPAPREDEAASEPGTSSEAFQSDDWWRESAPESDWAQPVSNATATEIGQRKEFGTADVYFCGRKNLFPLNLAIRAIGKENLTGLLRACWDQEPIDILARDGEIVLATTRDPDLYCPETPDVLRGVDVVMIFDTWGGMLAADQWRRFSLAPMRSVLERLSRTAGRARVPAIVFTKGGGAWLDDLAESGADCVGVDWTVDIGAARRQIGSRVAVQGNLDPMVLLTDPETIASAADAVIDAAGRSPGHIFNLGHGIVPATPPENVATLVHAVHRRSNAPSRQSIGT